MEDSFVLISKHLIFGTINKLAVKNSEPIPKLIRNSLNDTFISKITEIIVNIINLPKAVNAYFLKVYLQIKYHLLL